MVAPVQLGLCALVVASLLLPLSDLARGLALGVLTVVSFALALLTVSRWRRSGALPPGLMLWANVVAGFPGPVMGIVYLNPWGNAGPGETVIQGLAIGVFFAVIMWFVHGPSAPSSQDRRPSTEPTRTAGRT